MDDTWVQWAIDMLEAGYDTEHLRILAGAVPPFNVWYTSALTDSVFNELGINLTDTNAITHNYIAYIVSQAVTGKDSAINALTILRQLYIDDVSADGLQDFYLLYCAWQDLEYDVNQRYWPGATEKNIEYLALDYFKQWLAKNAVQ